MAQASHFLFFWLILAKNPLTKTLKFANISFNPFNWIM